MIIAKVDSIITDDEGVILKIGDAQVALSWAVIDQIAEASEPHYTSVMLNDFALMNANKGISQ